MNYRTNDNTHIYTHAPPPYIYIYVTAIWIIDSCRCVYHVFVPIMLPVFVVPAEPVLGDVPREVEVPDMPNELLPPDDGNVAK